DRSDWTSGQERTRDGFPVLPTPSSGSAVLRHVHQLTGLLDEHRISLADLFRSKIRVKMGAGASSVNTQHNQRLNDCFTPDKVERATVCDAVVQSGADGQSGALPSVKTSSQTAAGA